MTVVEKEYRTVDIRFAPDFIAEQRRYRHVLGVLYRGDLLECHFDIAVISHPADQRYSRPIFGEA